MASHLALLRLPVLAQIEVFESMNVDELIRLAQASEKFRRHMKTHYRLPVHLRVSEVVSVKSMELTFIGKRRYKAFLRIEKRSDLIGKAELFKFGKKKVWATIVPTMKDESSSTWRTYWGPKYFFESQQEIIDFLKTAFEIQSVDFNSVHYDQYSPSHAHRVLNHILACNLKIKYLNWSTYSEDKATLDNVLAAAINVEDFFFHPYENRYIMRFHRFHEYSLNSLSMNKAHWITVENLCALVNCSKVTLTGAKFTSQELNFFLKHFTETPGRVAQWRLSGDLPPKLEAVMDGVDCVKTGDATWIVQTNYGVKFDVECRDGTFSLIVRTESV